MATYANITLLTDLGFSYEDAHRAMQQAAGDGNRAANILFSKRQVRQRTNTSERAGPSRSLATPPKTASPKTITIPDNEEEPDTKESDNDDLYGLPTPKHTPATATTTATDSEDDAEGDDDGLYAPPWPTPARKTPASTVSVADIPSPAPTPAKTVIPANNLNINAELSGNENTGPPCVCQEANNHNMIQCTTCHRWFHYKCVNLTATAIPSGVWCCHFEPNPTSLPIDNSGFKLDELESRALYLTVKHLAPLSKGFWENVSSYLKTQFNIVRSHTSVKLDWVRNSSAIWGFDERDATQYGEHDVAMRKRLQRSQIENKGGPPRLTFRAIGQGLKKVQSTVKVKAKPAKQTKRKRSSIEDESDSVSEDEPPVPAIKRRRPVVHKSVASKRVDHTLMGGKYVNVDGKPVPSMNGKHKSANTFIPKPVAHKSIACKAPVERVNSPAPATVAITTVAKQPLPQNQALATTPITTARAATFIAAVQQEPTQCYGDQLLSPLFPTSHGTIPPDDFNSDYMCCIYGPPPPYQSRFDALAEHRRYVKNMLKDVEPNLDWYEGPWEGEDELLWRETENGSRGRICIHD
jgi:hypothetical protein